MEFPDQKVLYRSDTKAPLSVVSGRYQVVQPQQVLEFYRDLTEVSGYELETAGVLKAGRKFWALARTGKSSALKGNDVVNGYLLLATSCDGTLATTATPTTIRVVCNNTLSIALSGASSAIKVPHSTSFDAQAVKKQLGIAVSQWDSFMYRMKTLSERKVKAAGMDQGALENAARSGLALGEFEDSEEDGVAVVEEFYPVEGDSLDDGGAGNGSGIRPELVDKLRMKAGGEFGAFGGKRGLRTYTTPALARAGVVGGFSFG